LLDWLAGSLLNSISVGSIYFVISIGLTLTLAVVKLPNFAHAEFLTVGAYSGIVVSALFPNNIVVACAVAFAICAALAVAINHIVFRPLINRKVSIYILVLASFAVAQLVRYIVFVWASVGNVLASAPSLAIVAIGSFGNATVTNINLISILLTIIVASLLAIFLNFTIIGKSMRAVASNLELAKLTGINVAFVVNLMWIIAGGLAGMGGVVFGAYTTVTPVLGLNTLLDIFSVVIIAGLTSVTGTIVGAYIVGFSENTLIAALNHYFGVPYSYSPIMPFALIVIILLLKPTGLAPSSRSGIVYIRRLFIRPGKSTDTRTQRRM
jgi:branched-subunit amino acid ABC-type transport system permease component